MRAATMSILLLIAGFQVGTAWAQLEGWNPNREKEAREAIRDALEADPGMAAYFDQAYGYAVFPTVGKGGWWVGGAYGSGTVFEGGEAVGTAEVFQATLGLQFGGQAYTEFVFFEDKESMDRFKADKLEISAQASAVAITAGASADAAYESGVAIFTMTKGGLMGEASVGGQGFKFEPKS